jgi:dTDP-L-rhamnose 4-epimerase
MDRDLGDEVMGKGCVCVTGGCGFIGSHLIRLLREEGFTVRIVDNLSPQIHGNIPVLDADLFGDEGITFTRMDISDLKRLEPVLDGVDYIVHLAAETGTAQSMYEIAHYNSVNSQGTALLMDYLVNGRHSVKKVILASSRSIYGEGAYHCDACGNITPESRTDETLGHGRWEPCCPICAGPLALIATPESSRPKPASIYAATKLAQEDLVRIACGSVGIPFGILRFQNVFGEGQSLKNPYTGILSIFSTRVRRGLDLPIFEDGLESRDFVHVRDVARAVFLCMASGTVSNGIYNVGSGIPTTVLDVAQKLIGVFNSSSKIVVTGQYRLGDIRHCYADISAIDKATGFRPNVSLEDGLAAFGKWVEGEALPEDGLDRVNQILVEKGLMK